MVVFPRADCLERLLQHAGREDIGILAPRRLQEGKLFTHEFQGYVFRKVSLNGDPPDKFRYTSAAYKPVSYTHLDVYKRQEQETDSSIVVNWSKFLSEPIEGVDPFGGKTSPGRSLPQLNKILQVDVHEKNLEVSVQYGFEGTTQPFLTTIRKSLLLLPEQPMQPRIHDARVGYDNIPKRKFNFDTPSIAAENYITRFRIVPSPKDVKALVHTGIDNNYHMEVIEAVERVNERQKSIVYDKITILMGES